MNGGFKPEAWYFMLDSFYSVLVPTIRVTNVREKNVIFFFNAFA